MSADKKAKLEAAIADLANDMRDTVASIESDTIPTTQNHYGRYMNIIIMCANGDATKGKIIALALIAAGANRRGVSSAYAVTFGGPL